jgi:hypothetical protein
MSGIFQPSTRPTLSLRWSQNYQIRIFGNLIAGRRAQYLRTVAPDH